MGTMIMDDTARTAWSPVNISQTALGKSRMNALKAVEKVRPAMATHLTTFETRPYLRAPIFCPTMELPAVVKELATTPNIMPVLL